MNEQKSLFISNNFDGKNGSSKAAVNFLFSFLKTHHNPYILSPSKYIIDTFYISKYNIENPKFIKSGYITPLPPKRSSIRPKKILKWTKDCFLNSLAARRILNVSFQNIFVNSFSGHFLFDFFKIKNFKKSIFILHGSPDVFLSPTSNNISPYTLSAILNRYDHIISVSENIIPSWKSCGLHPESNISVIKNCCLEKNIFSLLNITKEKIKEKLEINDTDFTISIIGSIIPRKGQDIILENITTLLKNIPNISILFIGKIDNDTYYQRITAKKEVQAAISDGKIKFLGFKKNALEYIYASDLLILPSRAEALPLCILESMALKTPILASNVDGNTELIRDKENGYIFDINKPDEFAKKVIYIHKKYTKSVSLANVGYQEYWKFYSQSAQFKKMKIFTSHI